LEENPVGHEQGKKRPFFVISPYDYNIKSSTPIGFIMSTSEKKSKNNYSMPLGNSFVNVSQIRTLDISRFGKFIQHIDKDLGLKVVRKFINQLVCYDLTDRNRLIDLLKL